jgi:hypothetical protein
MRTFSRFGAVAALAIVMALSLVTSPASAAEGGEGSITLHFRWCPAGATDLMADCHDHPIAGLPVAIYDNDGGEWWGETDEDGNATFTAWENDYLYGWWYNEEADGAPALDDYVLSYCSLIGGDGSDIEVADSQADHPEDFLFDVLEGDEVVCDVYFWNWDMDAVDGGAETPNTGAGPMTTGTSAGFFLAGAVALGGLAVASRKRAFR